MSKSAEADPAARLARIESRLEQMEASLAGTSRAHARTNQRLLQDISAILRILTVGRNESSPEALMARRFRLASQNEEDGITYALLQAVGPPVRRFVEIGAGDNGGNSGFLASELGFEGMMVDASEQALASLRPLAANGKVKLISTWVTAENINELVAENGFGTEVDVLSIDIDGNDYWVWKNLTMCDPRIVIVEYNAVFGPERSVAVPYDPRFVMPLKGPLRKVYYGASLRALTDLGKNKGYRLVGVEPTMGVNAFFLRADLAPELPGRDPKAVFRVNQDIYWKLPADFDIWNIIESERREIIDFDKTGLAAP